MPVLSIESYKNLKDSPIQRMVRRYNEFLHRIQMAKMRELWDNEEDQEWEKG
jgi:hypothetical protein